MKTILTMLGVLLATLCLISPAPAVEENLSAATVRSAIAFGRAHRTRIQQVLEQRYANPARTAYDDRFLVRTKWCKLAYLAAIEDNATEAFRVGRDAILDDHCLQIDIRVFGHSLHFARDYQVRLIRNDAETLPCKRHADHYQVRRRPGPATALPGYAATIRTYFPYTALQPDAAYSLEVSAPGFMRRFTVDLSAYP